MRPKSYALSTTFEARSIRLTPPARSYSDCARLRPTKRPHLAHIDLASARRFAWLGCGCFRRSCSQQRTVCDGPCGPAGAHRHVARHYRRAPRQRTAFGCGAPKMPPPAPPRRVLPHAARCRRDQIRGAAQRPAPIARVSRDTRQHRPSAHGRNSLIPCRNPLVHDDKLGSEDRARRNLGGRERPAKGRGV